jgi:hypothetical protein
MTGDREKSVAGVILFNQNNKVFLKKYFILLNFTHLFILIKIIKFF